MTTYDLTRVVNAFIEALEAHPTIGKPVGDGKAPADRSLPYWVVHVIPGGRLDGDMGEPVHMADVVVQVNATGANREQAMHARERVRSVIFGRTNGTWSTVIAGAGWRCYHRELDSDGGIERGEGDLFTASDRYRLHTTPV